MVLSASQIATVAHRSGRWDGSDLIMSVAVALAESSGKPDERGGPNSDGTYDYGLWQINSIHTAILGRGNWADPDTNASMARAVYDDAGGSWTPWSTYKNGRAALFMGQATAAVQNLDPNAVVPTTPGGSGGTPGVENVSAVSSVVTFLPKKIWDAIGGAWWMERVGMVVLGTFLLFLALLKTRTGTKMVGHAKKVAVRAAEVAAVA